MDSGNLSIKTLIINAGINNSQFKEKTLALYDDFLTELKHKKTVLDEGAFGTKGTPELVYTNLGNSLEPIKKALNSHLVILIGNRDDTRFQQAGKLLSRKLKPGSYPVLFTLQVGAANEVPRPIRPLECWVNIEIESIPTFIRDIVAWATFPNLVGCDWSDIFSAIGGKPCRLLVFKSDNIDSGDEYQRFLSRHEDLLNRARGIFILICIDKNMGDPMGIFQKLLDPLDKILNRDCEIAWSDCMYTALPVKIRIAFLIATE